MTTNLLDNFTLDVLRSRMAELRPIVREMFINPKDLDLLHMAAMEDVNGYRHPGLYHGITYYVDPMVRQGTAKFLWSDGSATECNLGPARSYEDASVAANCVPIQLTPPPHTPARANPPGSSTDPATQGDARLIVEALISGIETWASDEDGIPPDIWEAYQRARIFVGRAQVEAPRP